MSERRQKVETINLSKKLYYIQDCKNVRPWSSSVSTSLIYNSFVLRSFIVVSFIQKKKAQRERRLTSFSLYRNLCFPISKTYDVNILYRYFLINFKHMTIFLMLRWSFEQLVDHNLLPLSCIYLIVKY